MSKKLDELSAVMNKRFINALCHDPIETQKALSNYIGNLEGLIVALLKERNMKFEVVVALLDDVR